MLIIYFCNVMEKNLVIIPTYNEAENVITMIKKVFSIHGKKFDILIVDDSSPDGTASLVKKLIKKHQPQLYLLERDKKIGLGAAYISGFNWGLENKYDYFFQMDCDFSHDPNDLKRLHNVISNNEADMVVGSRYISGVNVVNWPMSRVLLSYFASKYVRFFTRIKIADSTAGFNGYKREILENIDFRKIKFMGYAFQIEMKYRSWKMNFKIKEIPIIFRDRELGDSKISKKIIWEGVFGVFRLIFRNMFFSNEFKRKK